MLFFYIQTKTQVMRVTNIMAVLNLSGYLFTSLSELPQLRETLKQQCREIGLKGTILLSDEGINIFVAGTQSVVDQFYTVLKQLPLPEIEFKISYSEDIPFKRMLVKIKPEIISMGHPEVNPAIQHAPYVSAKTFKKWLDEGKELVIIDTRNDYEVRCGKFHNAIAFDIDHFRQFPQACDSLSNELKDKTIVTYCTGGIRCEKAAPFLQSLGFKDVYQLEGGIVKYFEECGQTHYQGECFVFDKRIAVDHTLQESDTVQCFKCRMPVTATEQQSSQYQEHISCPSCH